MQGLYASCYGLNEAEELKRQTYALLATPAFAAIFALAFQVGGIVSRLLLALVFIGLLVLCPLAPHYVKKWMMGWDCPASTDGFILSHGDTSPV